jgi:hypothetical protein
MKYSQNANIAAIFVPPIPAIFIGTTIGKGQAMRGLSISVFELNLKK